LLEAILAPFKIFSMDHHAVHHYGEVRATLENSSVGIAAPDSFIAAQALSLAPTSVTSNEKEFR
jgi:tRNA(fMet)-specific endonuclease VapC